MDALAHREDFETYGRVWLRNLVDESELETLATLGSTGGRPGARIGPKSDLAKAIRRSKWITRLVEIWPAAKPVRVVSFDKTVSANWQLGWHQDRVIAVHKKHKLSEFGNWSCKDGQWHCEPPEHIFESMLFVRVHIDACDEGNGAMVIAQGSHAEGKVRKESRDKIVSQYPHESCNASPGDVLVLKMLTWHKSPISKTLSPRRSLRIDFALGELPTPLEWPE